VISGKVPVTFMVKGKTTYCFTLRWRLECSR
jgi:hypothetical protein